MFRRTVMAGAVALAAAAGLVAAPAAQAQAPTEIQFWHGLTQPLGGMLEQIAADFNASQNRYRVTASFRGSYPETMVAAIAAFRAGQAPGIVQMFEVGTGTMMAAGRAIKPVHELLAETNTQINFQDYLPGVRGYYSLPDGRMMSMPFNSSTAVVFYNKDAFRRANLNPDAFPETWEGVEAAARALKAAGVACPMTTAWPTWLMIEQFSAIHNVPLASQGNGMAGLNAELRINNPLMVRHMNNLVAWQRDGIFRYGGRDGAGDALFPNGECAMIFASSGLRARIMREAQFQWGVGMLPVYQGTTAINSIIGGASFWVMNRGPNAARSADELAGTAQFFAWLARPEVAAKWHTDTGFLPVTRTAFEQVRATGFYGQPAHAGADVPIQQMLRGGGQMTENSMGIRLGGFVEIRTIIQEEMERAFQGQQTGEQALNNAVTRGNVVLRNFERQNRGG
jgi:sn-glycerol 3-phosphate transport system substrate-binding protein